MLTKQAFIAAVAEKAGLTQKDTDAAVNAAIAVITEELKNGGKVQLTGFGTFEVREHAARTGRNPATGETIEIAAGKSPAFKPGKKLKDSL
ncbi:MAG: HU family DNA-binding protein [Clostridia bacterium]|nr:HU family DNA-binding protein [Clostridia bacterium]